MWVFWMKSRPRFAGETGIGLPEYPNRTSSILNGGSAVRCRFPLSLSLIVLLSVSSTLAKEKPAAPASQPHKPITLYAQVTDKAGLPVRGLTQQDFTVTDNKNAANITSFQPVDNRSSAANVKVVLVVDGINADQATLGRVHDVLRQFLLRDGGQLTVPVTFSVANEHGTTVPLPATLDGKALLASYNQAAPGLREERHGFYEAMDRLSMSMKAVSELAAYEAKQPGRKLVIWLSPGWPILTGPRLLYSSGQRRNIFNEVVALSSAVAQAGMTMYDIDPLGMWDAATFRTNYYKGFLKGLKSVSDADPIYLALQVMSVESGGLVLNSGNDIKKEILECTADARSYYVLSFAPLPGKPGEYHQLQVKVDKPDLQVRTRTGYYSQP